MGLLLGRSPLFDRPTTQMPNKRKSLQSVTVALLALNWLLLCCLPADPQKQNSSTHSRPTRLQHANAINTPADKPEMERCWPTAVEHVSHMAFKIGLPAFYINTGFDFRFLSLFFKLNV